MAAARRGAADGRRSSRRARRLRQAPEPDDESLHLEIASLYEIEDAVMSIATFESGILRSAVLSSLALVVGLGTATLSWSDEGAAGLSLMPQPRSITRGTGSLN